MAPTLTGLVERVAQWVLPPAPLPPELLAAAPIDLTDMGNGVWEEPPPLTSGAMAAVNAPPAFEDAPMSLTAAPTGQRSLRPPPAARPPMLPLSQQAPVQTAWSAKAWSYYRSSGEARQAVDWVAGGISRFRLFVGTGTNDGSGDPEPMDDPGVAGEVLAELFEGPMGQQEALKKLAVNLLVPGEAWMVGYPKAADPFDTEPGLPVPAPRPAEPTRPTRWGGSWADFAEPDARPGNQQGTPASWQADRATVEGETSWAVVTRREWQEMDSGRLRLKLPDDPRRTADHWVEFEPGDVVIMPVYQPDPEDASRATSAFEAAMAIFEELDGLNRRVGADINSRLAGAGVAVVSENATMPAPGPEQGAGVNPMRPRGFLASLLTAISTAISNPDSASAVAPIILQVPDEAFQGEGPIKHVTFATPFDAQVPVLREDARRRVAVVMDIPASIVNGIEDLNHWSAWAVSDDAIRSHLGPLASLICSTITRKILWPVLRAAGVEDWRKYVIWWDASELVLRPDRSTEALAAHSQGAISDRALRRTLAFDEEDAPGPDELARRQVEAARQRIAGGSSGGPQGGQATPGDRPEAPNQQQSDARMNRRYEAGPPARNRPNPASPPTVAAAASRVA